MAWQSLAGFIGVFIVLNPDFNDFDYKEISTYCMCFMLFDINDNYEIYF